MSATPTSLTATTTRGGLSLAWGVSTTEGLAAFLVHWRPVASPPVPWSTVQVSSSARSYSITGLQVESIEYEVRALVAGGVAAATATPLSPQAAGVMFTPGVNSGYTPEDVVAVRSLAAKLVRAEVAASNISAAGALIEGWAANGVSVQLLVSFDGSMITPAQVTALATLAAKYGPRSGLSHPVTAIELGNETSYEYQYPGVPAASAAYAQRAQAYAQRTAEAAGLLAPLGVGVLAQGSDGGTNTSAWADAMFGSVPALSGCVAGWTIHPYSSQQTAAGVDHWGVPMMQRMVAQLAKHGDTTTPFDVTEWGETSDNGVTLSDGKHLTYTEAAKITETHPAELKAAAGSHPIHTFMVYQDRDQQPVGATTNRECYFGALQHNGAPKEPYTAAVKHLLAG